MAVAPDTDEMLSTIPPRANGGNMDDPDIVDEIRARYIQRGNKKLGSFFDEGDAIEIRRIVSEADIANKFREAFGCPGQTGFELTSILSVG